MKKDEGIRMLLFLGLFVDFIFWCGILRQMVRCVFKMTVKTVCSLLHMGYKKEMRFLK